MNTTDQLRKLLDDYYRGSSYPGQTREICRLFSQLQSVPPDLLPDMEIFQAAAQLEASAAETPQSLENLMISTINECKEARPASRRPTLFLWLSIGCAAAVIAFLLTLGVNYPFSHSTVTNPPSPPIVAGTTPPAAELPPSDINPPTSPDEPPSSPQPDEPHQLLAKSTTHRAAPRSVKSARLEASTNIITDPIEAARHIDKAYSLLAKSKLRSLQTRDEALQSLDESTEIVNDVLIKLKAIK